MELPEKAFLLLDTLDRREISTQRQLADHSGLSLGWVNYILKSLLEKGLVKIGNFRSNPHKIGYMYLITPEGIEAKSRLAVKFVLSKLEEYENIKKALAERLAGLGEKGYSRIIFVGPRKVRDLVDSVIGQEGLNHIGVRSYRKWDELKAINPESIDIVLFFDSGLENGKKIADDLGIPGDKILPLW
ncbi:MAG: MarR family EPS-associated transcriptional regulator [Pseudomonadota bacterium]